MTQPILQHPSVGVCVQQGKSVLIVDDEYLIRWSLRSRLRAEGFDVTEAVDLATARLAFDLPLSLVLLDLRMPDGDGIELLREFRSRGMAAPIIVMTAHGTGMTETDAMASGAFAFVHKPFDLEEVVRLTQRAIAS